MTQLYDIAARVHTVAVDRGFDAPDWDVNFVQKVAFCVTELDEAVRAVADDEPISIELADTAIRILGILHAIWGENWSAGRIEQRRVNSKPVFEHVEVLLWPTLSHLCRAIEQWRVDNKQDAMICCELALLEVFRVADRLEIDLEAVIEVKTNTNALRPKCHGKARSVG